MKWLHQLTINGPGQADIKILMMNGSGLMEAKFIGSIGSKENQMMLVQMKITSYSIMEEVFGLMILQQNFNVHRSVSMTHDVLWVLFLQLYFYLNPSKYVQCAC